jgi:hypothetical protein
MTRRIAKKIARGVILRRYSVRSIREACRVIEYSQLATEFVLLCSTVGRVRE